MLKPLDHDICAAMDWVEGEAELTSALSGSDCPETREIRRVEVVLRRLASEAGYDLSTIEAEHE